MLHLKGDEEGRIVKERGDTLDSVLESSAKESKLQLSKLISDVALCPAYKCMCAANTVYKHT